MYSWRLELEGFMMANIRSFGFLTSWATNGKEEGRVVGLSGCKE